jgi:hypothetical protein
MPVRHGYSLKTPRSSSKWSGSEPIDGVIVPANEMGAGDVMLFESGLSEYLRRMKLKKSMLPRLDAFKREYIGDEVDGRRTFFDVQYEPIRRRYLSFMVHGNS